VRNAFEIRELDLGYTKDAPVLRIPELLIERGQLTFILGPSGAGKSTLLETLGLMKSTFIAKQSSQMDFIASNGERISLLDKWSTDGDLAADLRNSYFSFIFQSTNLMPNFTLGENICFTGMLEGKTLGEVKPRALELMSELNLDKELFDQPAANASGGQRQRAAFVRALSKDFEVLFGDEPTGNLDKGNAISLFSLLKDHLKESNKSAVIVSHDTELSEKFADKIVEIDYHQLEESKKRIGIIRP
jgi:lipoprotein-releasing system ATP-binding protein